MASSFEKSVKGGTKIKLAAPKSKYVEHILIATHAGEAGVAEIFRALQNRLRDSTWTIVFKSLIIVHFMIREGEPDVTLKYLAQSPHRRLAINNFTEVQTQGRNIRAYAEYLVQRSVSYGQTKVDYVRDGERRLKRLTIDKGLLRETESIQDQIRALIRCDFLSQEPENEITLMAFRLLTMDLLVLFHVMNEGTINVLEHYFEMSHPDAERALKIYRTFVKQTDQVVQYLSVARHYEHATRLEIPKIKHAPTSLSASLEEYLNDKDFEINRRQYLAQQEAKKAGGKSNGTSKLFGDMKPSASKSSITQSFPSPKQAKAEPAKTEAKGPAPDLIDFFESIEQNQQPMAQQTPQFQYTQSQPQQQVFQQNTGFQQTQLPSTTGQSTNPFAPQQAQVQSNFTGAGFGGYTTLPQQQQPFSPQLTSIPQNGIPTLNFQQPQAQQPLNSPPAQLQPQPTATNPFRQSMMPSVTGLSSNSMIQSPTGPQSPPFSVQNTGATNRSATNPFAKHASPSLSSSPFQSSLPQIQAPQPSPFQQPLPQPTGTNPFARNTSPSAGAGAFSPQSALSPQSTLAPNVTGSTNPFRQSTFVNQATGQGWQQGSQGTMGGLEQLDTVPIFPRPGQQQQSGQHGQAGQGQGW
ncbi:ANTH-domain-containing protein [Patellaria atrata CBS 101060]|uniref:ANTH-domain-containing protein n=1 Tax=Patellaria atrata CBS 101060 TaxID=1346257 RepID=A0A9P4S6W6_9PEZI|nr:ANTH-domain-containing protein [Patellaria atrata CBS 101060]